MAVRDALGLRVTIHRRESHAVIGVHARVVIVLFKNGVSGGGAGVREMRAKDK